ncbi:MAG: ribokinase [Ardenticatenaceae bacterium]|nr:ribokinase [Ardenticatenaceae bacterium]
MSINKIDYLVIGHITADLTPTGTTIGGTVAYSGRTAQTLGLETAVLSSAAADYNWQQALPGIQVQAIPTEYTSTFENIYTANGRHQLLHHVAAPITPTDVPQDWHRAAIVHLAPLTNEVDPNIVDLFSNSLIGMTPQGWLRRWDENKHVYARAWEAAAWILPHAAAVILSYEDLLDRAMLDQYRQWSRLLVMTDGEKGCTVFLGDEVRHIPTPIVRQVEPTGAGDIFAAAFLYRLYQTDGNPWEAARFANKIASQSVTQAGLDAKLDAIKRVIT